MDVAGVDAVSFFGKAFVEVGLGVVRVLANVPLGEGGLGGNEGFRFGAESVGGFVGWRLREREWRCEEKREKYRAFHLRSD